MRRVALQQDGTTRRKRRTKDELLEAAKTQEETSLTRFFARKPGPAPTEPEPAPIVSGFAKKVRGIVQTPAWCRSKERKEADRKRLAEPAAKEATCKRKAEPAAKEATRKRKAEPAAQLADAQRKSARRTATSTTKRQRVLQARAQRQEEVPTSTGMIITWATHHAPDTGSTSSGQALPAPVTRGSSSQAAADSSPAPPNGVLPTQTFYHR